VAELKAAAAAELGGLAVTDLVDQGKARAPRARPPGRPPSLRDRGACGLPFCRLKAFSSAGSARCSLAHAVLCTWALWHVERGGVYIHSRHRLLELSTNT
jgi:hypothetical protein